MAHIEYVDGLIREYLLFRGFSNTVKTYETELKTDKDKRFRADKLIDQLIHYINIHDLQALRDIWNHLDSHLFSKLEHSYVTPVKKLEYGILKYYLVIAFIANKTDKITQFFTKLSSELHSQSDWKDWFFFPFCKNPEEHPVFSVYFTKQWQDTLMISLHNFLATIFQCMPQPTIAKADTEIQLIKKLQEENTKLRNHLQQLTITTGSNVSPNNLLHHSIASTSTISSSTTSHQSRISLFQNQKQYDGKQLRLNTTTSSLSFNDILSFDITPSNHIIDDFYVIAQETNNLNNVVDTQTKGLRSLIRNISSAGGGGGGGIGGGGGGGGATSGTSPTLGRKESNDRNKKRSGSVGSRSWNLH